MIERLGKGGKKIIKKNGDIYIMMMWKETG